MVKRLFASAVFTCLLLALQAQERVFTPGGFIRGGMYYSTGDYPKDVNAAFADMAFLVDVTDNMHYKGFGDLRVRMGQQFGDNVNSLAVREAWGMYYNRYLGISLGKKIIKWGKTDIFTPLSRFSALDYTYRSPDLEDKDIGNLAAELTVTPAHFIRFTAVATPFWNPSILMTSPLELPPGISLDLPAGLYNQSGYHSLGFRGDLMLSAFDAGFQWYHGPDLMPGLSLLSADFSNILSPQVRISGVPYVVNQAGLDFEAPLAPFVARGALSYSKPVEKKTGNEEIPFPQFEWVGGFDWMPGDLRVTFEYSGKKVLDYYPMIYKPLLGTVPDLNELAALFATPGFDPVEFTRLQTEAFGRLYNNQVKEYYHSAGLRFEADMFHGRLTPSVTSIYNFTSRDLLVIPALRYKPADGLSISVGLEHYSGRKGGLYDIVDHFMRAAFVSLKIDF